MATSKSRTPRRSSEAAAAVGGWASRKQHRVVMPSGQGALIEIPGLGPLVLANAVPTLYLDLAREEITHKLGVTGFYGERVAELTKNDSEEASEEMQELTRTFGRLLKWLVCEHVVKGLLDGEGEVVPVKLDPDDLSDDAFPIEDLDWLYGVALRRVNEDALGRRLGVARLDEFATFRHEHGCPEDCEDCARLLDAVSTADLVPV